MGKRGHREEEILRVLPEAESGETVVEVYRKARDQLTVALPVEEEVCRSRVCRSCVSCGSYAMRTRS